MTKQNAAMSDSQPGFECRFRDVNQSVVAAFAFKRNRLIVTGLPENIVPLPQVTTPLRATIAFKKHFISVALLPRIESKC